MQYEGYAKFNVCVNSTKIKLQSFMRAICTKVLSFQVRQNLKDAGEDYKKLLLALKFGGVPSINNLASIYNFQVQEICFLLFNCIYINKNILTRINLENIT